MDIKELLLAEVSEYEFKKQVERKKVKTWLKTVSAFANGIGGSIFFGVDDQSNVVGITDVEQEITFITNKIKERIEPFPLFDVTTHDDSGKIIVRVYVRSGLQTPYYYSGDGVKQAFIRAGNQSIVAPSHILSELAMKGLNQSYDSINSTYKYDDLSFTYLKTTFKNALDIELDLSRDLKSFKLLNDNGILSNGGVLFADHSPIRQSRVFCTRWSGLQKGSISKDALDDKEYEGDIISQLENAKMFVKNNSKHSWVKTGSGRVESYDYPERAVHEAVVNAIIHRDYSQLGAEVHIDMYDNRLEIVSPGGMFDGRNIQDLKSLNISSVRRNPIIADLFHRLDFMERRGSGLQKIDNAYSDDYKPLFESDSYEFRVTLYNTNYEKVQEVVETTKSKHELLLEFCKNPKSVQEMMDKLQLKHRDNFRETYLKPLLDSHKLEMTIPDKPTSKNQKYRTVR